MHIPVSLLTCCQEMVVIHVLMDGSTVCMAVGSRLKVLVSLDHLWIQLHAAAAGDLQHCMGVGMGVTLQFMFYWSVLCKCSQHQQ